MTDQPVPPSLRSSLRACTAEGITAELVGACATGAVITAWAVHLGCSTQLVGMLGALPFFAQMFQAPGAWLTSRFGARRAALTTVALSRQCFLPLALLPWLPLGPDGKRLLLISCCAAHHAVGILCNNAWITWVGDLVPAQLRGRYFGRRTSLCTVASAAATLAVGCALDRSRARGAELALAGLALATCAAGAASVVLMARQRGGAPGAAPRWSLRAALKPLGDARARRLLAYLVVWNVAVGLSAPFFGLYLLEDLRAGFLALACTTALAALARTATAPAWGRATDRLGARSVLLACTAGLALSPLAWVCARPGHLWPLVLDAILGGALLGGHGVATFTLPLAIAPARERPHYHAAFSMAGGAAFTLASACGGALVALGPRLIAGAPSALVPLHLTFAVSVVARAGAAALALGVVDPAVAARSPAKNAVRTLVPRAFRVRSFAVRAGRRWMARGVSRRKTA